MKNKIKTLDLTPTWQGILPALMALLNDGGEEGRKGAIEELKSMAKAADQYRSVALLKDLKPEDNKIKEVADIAQQIFWDVVSLNYPEVKSGDFPPDATMEFDDACETAVDRWLTWNHPALQEKD